jgi:deazaflavin-dependent oxidoreductase (nitroreductase family)
MTDQTDWNQQIISEFRTNAGRVGGRFEGRPLLLLHSTGAKSGQVRVNPVMYQQVGESFAVFATKAGAPTNPDWYHNLVANPRATIEVGTETIEVSARVARGQEREQIWTRQQQRYPNFADYEQQTAGAREIPVIILERVG